MEEEKTGASGDRESEHRLGENIVLSGFSLEPSEMIVVKKIVGTYARKMAEKLAYQELKVKLKMSEKTKSFIHEIRLEMATDMGIISSSAEDRNLYKALSDALEKADRQIEHRINRK